MRTSVFAAAAFVAVAAAGKNDTASAVIVTDVVTAYTTVCPAATTFTQGNVTYTATSGQTVTVTNCPCTITKSAYSSAYVSCQTAAPSGSAVPYNNGTAPAVPAGSKTPAPIAPTQGGNSGSSASTKASAASTPIATGGAGRAAPVAGLAGLVGLAAFLF